MSEPILVIGNKNYSSWSLRAWLGLRQAGIPFTEKLVTLFDEDWPDSIRPYSPTLKVPVLIDGDVTVWESLAILEYAAERFPDAGLWPADPAARAVARAVSAEMHAGFAALRNAMPMNIRASHPGRGRDEGVAEDIARIMSLWNDCRARFGIGGPFLFGPFSAADAMFAPVASRFRTYAVELDRTSRDYADALFDLSAFKEWETAALAEPWIVAEDEIDPVDEAAITP